MGMSSRHWPFAMVSISQKNIDLKQSCLAGSSKEAIEKAHAIAGSPLPHLHIHIGLRILISTNNVESHYRSFEGKSIDLLV